MITILLDGNSASNCRNRKKVSKVVKKILDKEQNEHNKVVHFPEIDIFGFFCVIVFFFITTHGLVKRGNTS